MKSLRDDQLLRHWSENRSQTAFAEIGRRYSGMVYGVCLREIGDHTEAEDAAQAVFLLLAQKAPGLRKEGTLAGWLFRTAQLVSCGVRRRERRRINREVQAVYLQKAEAASCDENALWDNVEPFLNEALARLKSAEREIVLLRYFEGCSLVEIGKTLNVSENTARMRVTRAIEKLRVSLSRAGVSVSVSALTVLLSERGVRAAPERLLQSIISMTAETTETSTAAALLSSYHPTFPLRSAANASRAQQLAKGAKIKMILSTAKILTTICGIFAVTAFLGLSRQKAFTQSALDVSASRAEALLEKAASTIQQTRSLVCECDKISHDPNTGRNEQRLYSVSLLRPNYVRVERYLIHAGGAASARERLVGLLSDGKTRRTILPNNSTEDEAAAADGKNVGLLLPDPLYDFYAPENAYVELVRQARADKTLTALTLDDPEKWEGATYQVITFSKTSRTDGKTSLFETRWFIGTDNLVHRMTVRDGAGILLYDIGLHNMRVNAPLAPSAFQYTPQPILPSPARQIYPPLLAEGTNAPDFTLADSQGKPVSLASLRGKTVILDFWATWCQPCLRSLPDLNRFADQRAKKGVVVLAVNVSDTQSAFDKWILHHPEYSAVRFAIDPRTSGEDIATVLYHVGSLPTQYIISPQGKIQASFVGYDPSMKKLDDAVNRAAK